MHIFAQKPKTAQQTTSDRTTLPARARFGQSREVNSILDLRRTVGNQAVRRVLEANTEDDKRDGPSAAGIAHFGYDFSRIPLHATAQAELQPKLEIGAPGDVYEQEADRVADDMLRISEPAAGSLAHEANGFRTRDEKAQNAQAVGGGLALDSGGEPLPASVRNFFEPRFGHDFSGVRVHTDIGSAALARDARALAFTVGQDVVFGPGQFSPHTEPGRRLLAHELTHVVQQGLSPGGRGNAHVSPVVAARVQRFESHEHVQLGDTAGGPAAGFILLECHNRDLPQHASPRITWPPDWQAYYDTLDSDQQRALTRGLTYGEVVALTGDLYVDFQALNRAPLREVINLIPRIRSASVKTQELQAETGGRYLALARENIGHFSNVPVGQRNRDIWRRNHIDAIAAARTGNANLAWGLNAAGDHFLTDAFSGGHLRVQRSLLHAQGTTGDVRSKVLHDLDNQFGVEVTNDRGDTPWIAYGDEHLNDTANARSRTLALEAVQLSKQDIADALAQGASYPATTAATVFAAERLIPQPVSMTANRWTSSDMRREIGGLAVSEAPGIASDLAGDDDRVRDWINRMDVAALSRQSETDVARMLAVLVSGVVTDGDMRAIERLLGSVTDATVMSRLRAAFRPRAIGLNDFGLRMRFRIALVRTP